MKDPEPVRTVRRIQGIEGRVAGAQYSLPEEVETMARVVLRVALHDRVPDLLQTVHLVEHCDACGEARSEEILLGHQPG